MVGQGVRGMVGKGKGTKGRVKEEEEKGKAGV